MNKQPFTPEEIEMINEADAASRAEAAQILGPQVAEHFFDYTDARREEQNPSSMTRDNA